MILYDASVIEPPSDNEEDMNACTNFNTMMPDEVLQEVLTWLPVPELLCSVAQVSRRFYGMLQQDNMLWNRKLLELISSSSRESPGPALPSSHQEIGLNRHQMQRCCWLAEHNRSSNEDEEDHPPLLPACLQYGRLFVGRMEATRLLYGGFSNPSNFRRRAVKRYVCLASSSDHPHERIENVLDDGPNTRQNAGQNAEEEQVWNSIRNADRNSEQTFLEGRQAALFSFSQPWWSSLPRTSDDSNEVLAFSMRYPKCLISEVAIKPYTDWMGQTYTWKHLIVRVYNLLPLVTTTSNDGDETPMKCLLPSNSRNTDDSSMDEEHVYRAPLEYLATQTPVYESELLDTPPSMNNSWQYHELPFGVIGNVITLNLIGKHFRQFESSGYYVCVHSVAARGIPLFESAPPPVNLEQETRRETASRRDMEIIPLVVM